MDKRFIRIAWIDYLKVLAILLVLVSHSNNILWEVYAKTIPTPPPWGYGTYGVALFFMLSGYVVHGKYLEIFKWSSFFYRRFINIFPWYWASIILVIVFNPLNIKLPV